ncbi:ATP-binding protein [Psychromonas sp. Urea-02u-13]|uniref:ATP-binding protein n=1 Tax=Psychromonas sp. Urea-02u-13 TaxID=2058326 RepID=UPI000C328AA6|nr:ATP-binding protein [Psychromonas sp. Urea-02u-13]PKG37380.1 hypothetical protein CXF74_19150 [Psychromonas sp. Urea-02u-13]
MENNSPRLFTRLYTSIIFALLFSVLLTRVSVQQLFDQDGINDFVRDTHYIYLQLQIQIIASPEKVRNMPHAGVAFINEFDLQWRALSQKIPFCTDCNYIGDANGIRVFELADLRLLAVYDLPEHNLQLLISDSLQQSTPQNNEPNQEWAEYQEIDDVDVEQIVFYLFTLISIIAIGAAVYFPISQLQKQIMTLVATNKQFGEGKLNVRSDRHFSKPLDELASSFNNMANAITDTVKENQIFAQAVPHEVRTPLSRIQLAVGLLQKMNEDQRQLALLENIETYIDDIDDLISQIVAFSRLNSVTDETPVQQTQSIQLSTFVASRLASIKHDSTIHTVINIDASIHYIANPMYLRLVLDNLMKNALSYAKSEVRISVKQQSGHFILSVEDDGQGIATEHYETIFFPFSRLDKSRSRKTGGLGIGLSITKAATKKMHADIAVGKSELGGALFRCFLFKHSV